MKRHDSLNLRPALDRISRRNFLRLMGLGATAMAARPAWAAFDLPADDLAAWKKSLFKPAVSRIYRSDKHTDARLHLGGIGTGNFEIGADGRLTTWQLFNTLRDGSVPFCFGIKAGHTAKLLQTAETRGWPSVKQIEMTGDYPVATLRFVDDDLPVRVELEAFTPFSPLDTDDSSLPLAVFKFRLRNPGNEPQIVSLTAMMANPVGYAAIGAIEGNSHPSLGSNVNETFRHGRAGAVLLRAGAGADATLDKPVDIYMPEDLFLVPPDPNIDDKNYAGTNHHDLSIPPLDRPKNLRIHRLVTNKIRPHAKLPSSRAVIWLEDAPAGLSDSVLTAAAKMVKQGATLVFSGDAMPLVRAYAGACGGQPLASVRPRPDIIFDDFESGYGKWKVTGDAFGPGPAHGAMGNQQPVSGFLGSGLVNSYYNGDDTTGKMTSAEFTVDRKFIRFLVGGGHYRTTQIRLIVGGKTVRATSGQDNERLLPAVWDVQEFGGKTAHLEIVDEQKGGWGHINIDQIVFSDSAVNEAAMEALDGLLPEECRDLKSLSPDNHSREYTRQIGAGRVVVICGRLLDPAQVYSARVRQGVYQKLCAFAGATYTPTEGQSAREPGFGTLALAALADDVTALTSFENWDDAWKEFQQNGRLAAFKEETSPPSAPGQTTNTALAATVTVPAGGEIETQFFLTWHYPNKYNGDGASMGCYYATQWADARAVMRDAISRHDALGGRTALFRKTFYDSTLPYWLLDAATANAAIGRHVGVVFRIANGDVYGWEGSNASCAPTCTHVWGYEQAFAHLFPALEKEMRRIDFTHQQRPDGGVNNRTAVPSPPHPTGEPPFTDGHASCILKAYREALNSPDETFFRDYWPHVKHAVEYLIDRDAAAAGGKPSGILQDDQLNTYDEALHGVTTFLSGYYLAALRAGEEWARRMGDTATADHFHAIFDSGRSRLVELCWNGEYFAQHLEDYAARRGEVGPGCMSDQLIGQWWAHQLGLGYILPEDKVKSALRAIYNYNFKTDLTGWKHWPRAFAGAGDKGLIICTWPKGGRPAGVMLYSDEVWTGIEYQVAAHLIYEGMIEEGFAIVKGARDRYDGVPRAPIQRNPWCEIECGGHYTRAMSSWSLLLALSGVHYDGPRGAMRFAPQYKPEKFKSFFTGDQAWGSLAQTAGAATQKAVISVAAGTLRLATLDLAPQLDKINAATASIGGTTFSPAFSNADGLVRLSFGEGGIHVGAGENLEIVLT